MSSDTWPLWGIILLVVLIFINAYFTAARRALTSVNKANLRALAEEGEIRAHRALRFLEKPNEYKLSIRSLNLLIRSFSAILAVDIYTDPLAACICGSGISSEAGKWVAGILIFIVYCFILLSLGEVLPRRLAVIYNDSIALKTSFAVAIAIIIMKPLVLCVSAFVFLILKLFKLRTDINDNEYSEENIVEMLEAGQESGELKEEGKKMITGVFAFDDILAYEIMTPRTDVFAIDINDPPEEYIDELMELRYSRIPVYEDDHDNIIGILYIKDYLIKARLEGFDHVDFREILRKPYFVPETKNIDALFIELQKTKQHIAILIDEYGGFSGIVTMEDIIEEVMGDIDDEYDESMEEIKKIGPDLYLIDGGADLDDINDELNTDLQSDTAETIGGLIIDMFGEIPDEDDIGKEIPLGNYFFTVKAVKDRRIEQVVLKILNPDHKKHRADKIR